MEAEEAERGRDHLKPVALPIRQNDFFFEENQRPCVQGLQKSEPDGIHAWVNQIDWEVHHSSVPDGHLFLSRESVFLRCPTEGKLQLGFSVALVFAPGAKFHAAPFQFSFAVSFFHV